MPPFDIGHGHEVPTNLLAFPPQHPVTSQPVHSPQIVQHAGGTGGGGAGVNPLRAIGSFAENLGRKVLILTPEEQLGIIRSSTSQAEASAKLKSVLRSHGFDTTRSIQSTQGEDNRAYYVQTPASPKSESAESPVSAPTNSNSSPVSSGDRQTFSSGAVRSNHVAGGAEAAFPPRFDLLSPLAMRRLAETAGEGCAKYGPDNWRAGFPVSDLSNRAIAHIFTWLTGDRSEDHLAHAMWNLHAILHFEELGRTDLFDIKTDDYAPLFAAAQEVFGTTD